MALSPFDQISSFLNIRTRKPRTSVSKLQTRVWIDCILREHQLDKTQLESSLSNGSDPKGQVYKWLRGANCVTESKVRQIDRVLPGSKEVFNLPLFDLLQNRPIKKSELIRLVSPYSDNNDDLIFWRLPEIYKGEDDGISIPIILPDNLDMLYQRGGIFSFIAILYIVRRSESEGDAYLHLEAVKHAYKSFPSLARHQDFIGHWQDILKAFQLIHLRVPTSALLVQPDIDIIKKQIESEHFITLRELRPRHPLTHRFEDNETPYKEATIPFND
jgi:hypothetical protein